jgi:preprotein translocase subunit SecG
MTLFLTVLHVIACFFLIVVVLLQRGKGAEVGAVFGGGAGATVFGSRGAGNFLTRLTTGAAVTFMVTSLSLAYLAQDRGADSLFEGEETLPAAPESPFGGAPAPAETTGGFEEIPVQQAPAAAPGSATEGAEAPAEAPPAAEGAPEAAAPEAPPADPEP